MPVDLTDEMGAAVQPIVDKEVKRLWPRADPVAQKMVWGAAKRKETIRGGITWEYPFSYTGKTDVVEFTDPYQTFEFGGKKTASMLSTSPIHLEHNISIAQLELDQASGEAMLINLKDEKVKALTEGFQQQFAKKLWGTVSSDMNDIQSLLTAGLTIMNLAPADVTGVGFHPTDAARSLWGPQIDAGPTVLSDHAITAHMKKISQGYSQYKPEMIVSNDVVHQAWLDIHQGQVRYMDEEMLKVGFDDQTSVNRVPWFPSIYCPGSGTAADDNWVVFLRPSDYYWTTMAGREMTTKNYSMLPKQASTVIQVFFSGQCIIRDREHQGALTGVSAMIA